MRVCPLGQPCRFWREFEQPGELKTRPACIAMRAMVAAHPATRVLTNQNSCASFIPHNRNVPTRKTEVTTMSQQWYYATADRKQIGPVTSQELRNRVASGEVTASTLVLLEGTTDWHRADSIGGLVPKTSVPNDNLHSAVTTSAPPLISPLAQSLPPD